MKRNLIFIMLALTLTGKAMAQTVDKYPISQLALLSTTDASKGIPLGEDISKAIEAFGQPSRVEDYCFETDGVMGKLYVPDGKPDSCHIVNNSIAIGEKSGTTSETIHTFRNFHVEKRTGVSQNVKYVCISAATHLLTEKVRYQTL